MNGTTHTQTLNTNSHTHTHIHTCTHRHAHTRTRKHTHTPHMEAHIEEVLDVCMRKPIMDPHTEA
jgi:hypothetical protein